MDRYERLKTEQNLWLATLRSNNRPHLVPIWFTWVNERLYICTGRQSVKARNLVQNEWASIALQDGGQPVVAECRARLLEQPFSAPVVEAFQQKYEWNITQDREYEALFELEPLRWVMG